MSRSASIVTRGLVTSVAGFVNVQPGTALATRGLICNQLAVFTRPTNTGRAGNLKPLDETEFGDVAATDDGPAGSVLDVATGAAGNLKPTDPEE